MVKVDPHDNHRQGSDMVIKFTSEGPRRHGVRAQAGGSDEETGPLKHPNPPLPADPGRFRQVTDVAFDAADNTSEVPTVLSFRSIDDI